MKTLLTVIGILLLATILFFVIGVISPGQRTFSEIQVNVPIDYCWQFYHDEVLKNEWMSGIEKYELVSGKKNTVGAEYVLTMEAKAGKASKTYETVTDFDPVSSYAITYHNDMLTGSTEVEFKDQGDSSTLILTENEYKAKTNFLRSMFHFFNWKIEEESKKQEETMKLLMEEEYMKKRKNKPNPKPQAMPVDTSRVN